MRPEARLLATVLDHCQVAGVVLDGSQQIVALHNRALLTQWLGEESGAAADVQSPLLLERLLPPQALRQLRQQLALQGEESGTLMDIGIVALHAQRSAARPRHVAITVHRMDTAPDITQLVMLREVSTAVEQQLSLQRSQTAVATAMALLRSAPDTIRLFLGSATASISAIRATLRMPARTHDALLEKLERVSVSAAQLAAESQAVGLAPAALACQELLDTLTQIRQRPSVSGDDALPLALLVDRIAGAIGDAWRMEEQRYSEQVRVARRSVAASTSRRARRAAGSISWAQATERRWGELLRKRGEEIGTLARLAMNGAELVPEQLQRPIDEMLQHLLRNALEHGIETPEERLAAEKSASGHISVKFEPLGATGIRVTIRDDGRGFDLARIGRAAVNCGLVSEESLLDHSAGDLVGLIFKPAFTTEGVVGIDGHGRGMTFLRSAVTRLNGQISVATKPGRYTQFIIELPTTVQSQEAEEAGSLSSLDKA